MVHTNIATIIEIIIKMLIITGPVKNIPPMLPPFTSIILTTEATIQ
jgi:hypothetical protein